MDERRREAEGGGGENGERKRESTAADNIDIQSTVMQLELTYCHA